MNIRKIIQFYSIKHLILRPIIDLFRFVREIEKKKNQQKNSYLIIFDEVHFFIIILITNLIQFKISNIN